MTTTFKNKGSAAVGAAPVTVYTVPGATTVVVQGMVIANILATDILVTVTWTDSSAAATYNLVKDAPIPAGGSIVIIDNNKLNLETADDIKVTSNTAASADVSLSYMAIA